MEQAILVFIVGLLVGWVTKIPFMLSHYKQWQQEKEAHEAFCNRVIGQLDEKLNHIRNDTR